MQEDNNTKIVNKPAANVTSFKYLETTVINHILYTDKVKINLNS